MQMVRKTFEDSSCPGLILPVPYVQDDTAVEVVTAKLIIWNFIDLPCRMT